MGRPRKQTPREPNGRTQRATTQADLNAIELRKQRAEMRTVAEQPHRKWTNDPFSHLAGTALRRFVVARKLKLELVTAGERLLREENRWRLLKGLTPICHSGEAPRMARPIEMTEAEMRAHRSKQETALRAVREANREIESAGQYALAAVECLCFGDFEPQPDWHSAAQDGLYALALHYGLIDIRTDYSMTAPLR